ncbi:hypothetical protein QYF61_026246, partial [Mycteria americana]
MSTVRQQKAERRTARDGEERLSHSRMRENSKRKAEGGMQKCEVLSQHFAAQNTRRVPPSNPDMPEGKFSPARCERKTKSYEGSDTATQLAKRRVRASELWAGGRFLGQKHHLGSSAELPGMQDGAGRKKTASKEPGQYRKGPGADLMPSLKGQQAHKSTRASSAGMHPAQTHQGTQLRNSNHTSVTMVLSESTPDWNLEKFSYSEMPLLRGTQSFLYLDEVTPFSENKRKECHSSEEAACSNLKEKPMTSPTSSDLANFISSGVKQHGYATRRTAPVYKGCGLKLLSPVEHEQALSKTNLAEVVQLAQPNSADLCSSAQSRSKMPPKGAAAAAVALRSALRSPQKARSSVISRQIKKDADQLEHSQWRPPGWLGLEHLRSGLEERLWEQGLASLGQGRLWGTHSNHVPVGKGLRRWSQALCRGITDKHQLYIILIRNWYQNILTHTDGSTKLPLLYPPPLTVKKHCK